MSEHVGLDPVDTPRRPHATRWIAAAVGTVAVLLVFVLATRPDADDRVEYSPLVGKIAPVIEGTTTSGERFQIDDYRGAWLVVNFFATWCVACRVEHPELVAFSEAHAEAGDAFVVSVAFDDSADNVARFFEDNGGDWPVLADGVATVALDYGVAGVPESFLIAPSGVVAAKITGGVTAAALDGYIGDMSSGNEEDAG